MTPQEKKEIIVLIKKVIKEELPQLFGRSLVQVKKFFITNIT